MALTLLHFAAFATGVAAAAEAELPRSFIDTTYEAPSGEVIAVRAGDDLQTAIDAAQPGDIIELEAGATFTGNFVLPNKPGDEWIHIRSSAYDSLPEPGSRVSPDHAPLMPRIESPNTQPAIRTAAAASHYRFVGVRITTTHSTTEHTHYNVIDLTAVGGQTSLDQVPTDLVFDRCYIHGTPTGNVRRGIALNSARTAIIDSYLADFHEVGADSQAIGGWQGPGPYKIVNNYIEGAGENLLIGGADPSIDGLVPSDIEIRGNHFYKPLSWRQGHPEYEGTPWTVKNLFELKNARRVLVDGNVFEHNWPHAQNGFAILFTVRNQSGDAPWSVVEDVTFINNIVRRVGSGINVLGHDDLQPSRQTRRIVIRNNLFTDVGGEWGGGRLFQLLDGTADVVIEGNTALQSDSILIAGDSRPHAGFVFIANIALHNDYGVIGGGTGPGLPTLERYLPNATFRDNVMISGEAERYPRGNHFPASIEAVGFANPAMGDYRLTRESPYASGDGDGEPPGVDFAALCARVAESAARTLGSCRTHGQGDDNASR